MLTPSDFQQLKLLYDRFAKMNAQINSLINLREFDELDDVVQKKDKLLKQIIFFEKSRIKDIKENSELDKIRINLIELEKQNIQLIKQLKEDMTKEFSDIKKSKKIISAYEPSLSEGVSTIDIKDEG